MDYSLHGICLAPTAASWIALRIRAGSVGHAAITSARESSMLEFDFFELGTSCSAGAFNAPHFAPPACSTFPKSFAENGCVVCFESLQA